MSEKFANLLKIKPDISLATFIQLWLLGDDAIIYIDVNINGETVLEHVKTIDPALEEYYDYKIANFEGAGAESQSLMTVNLKMEETDEHNIEN